MSRTIAVSNKPHVVCIPSPFQSHIKAILQFAQLLHHRGFHVTLVNTEHNHRQFLKSLGPTFLDGFPDFRFDTIPDGIPSSDEHNHSQDDLDFLRRAIREQFLFPFRVLVHKLNENVSLPVSSIVSDGFMPFTITVAEELGIPIVQFFTLSAVGFWSFMVLPNLVGRGIAPLKEESCLTDDLLDMEVDWIPGLKGVRLRHLGDSWKTINPDDLFFNFMLEAIEGAHKASAIIIHTFEALEQDVLEAISSNFPPVYAVGPLQLLLNQIPEYPLKSVGYSLRKEETEGLEWLNGRAPNSVVYANFGSFVVVTTDKVLEFAWGLASSNVPFLWVIRPDLVAGERAILPPEFLAETKERGLIHSWCPQEKVLNHLSVGGFLTHCGWNSTMETISAGVPILCWPVTGDQPMNFRYSCEQWGIGMEISSDVKRDEVKKLVEELMEGEKAKEMRNKVMKWKELGRGGLFSAGFFKCDIKQLS